MRRNLHSEAFKAEALRRLSVPGQTVQDLSTELGVHKSMLYRWRRNAGICGPMTKRSSPHIDRAPSSSETSQIPSSASIEPRQQRRPQDWTDDEKIAAVIESMSLTEEQLGGFLRQRGLYRATLDEWRESMLRGARAELSGHVARKSKKTKTAETKRIRQLERELFRKEKALAEAAALLVLQKKMRILLAGEDDDIEGPNE